MAIIEILVLFGLIAGHRKISGHYPDVDSAWLKMGLPDAYIFAANEPAPIYVSKWLKRMLWVSLFSA